MLQQLVPAVRTGLRRFKPQPTIHPKTNASHTQNINNNNNNTVFSPTSFCYHAARTPLYTRTKYITEWEKLIVVLIAFRNTQQFIKHWHFSQAQANAPHST